MGRKRIYTDEERLERHKLVAKKWRDKNKQKIYEINKQYYQNNKKKTNKYIKQYRKTQNGRASHLLGTYNLSDKKANRGKGDLTIQWIVDNIFTKPCIYCGKTDWRKLGCDRIDNSKPHTEDNVVPCCTECNKKRNKKPFEIFLKEMQQKMLEEFELP